MTARCAGLTWISIHALLAESDAAPQGSGRSRGVFLSTLSLRRATGLSYPYCTRLCYFYPRSPCGERPFRRQRARRGPQISIHALLAESDVVTCSGSMRYLDFYPRSPCGERLMLFTSFLSLGEFLSTLSLRRATHSAIMSARPYAFLSTLSLRRATPCSRTEKQKRLISIHALLAESDMFNAPALDDLVISIHALLAESDVTDFEAGTHDLNFYPRSPCGERRGAEPRGAKSNQDFYPRSPCGERRRALLGLPCIPHFYPRSPCGERPY